MFVQWGSQVAVSTFATACNASRAALARSVVSFCDLGGVQGLKNSPKNSSEEGYEPTYKTLRKGIASRALRGI